MVHIVGQVLVVAGALLFSTAGLGLLRLQDVYARLSAITTAAGLGMPLVLTGVFLLDPSWPDAVKLGIAIVLLMITSAVGGMTIARSAYLSGSPLRGGEGPVPDELREAEES